MRPLPIEDNEMWLRNTLDWLRINANTVGSLTDGLEFRSSRDTEGLGIKSRVRSRENALPKSPILGRDGHLVLAGFQWWSKLDCFMISMTYLTSWIISCEIAQELVSMLLITLKLVLALLFESLPPDVTNMEIIVSHSVGKWPPIELKYLLSSIWILKKSLICRV